MCTTEGYGRIPYALNSLRGSMLWLCAHNYKLLIAGLFFLQDPTAAHYMFQDDPFLIPRNAANSVGISFPILGSFPPAFV